jgi:penicillin-binding protein 1A
MQPLPEPPSLLLRLRERVRRWPLKHIALWGGGAAGLAAVSFGAYVAVLASNTPDLQQLRAAQHARPSTIVAAGGEPLSRFAATHVQPVPLASMSPEVVKALIATEDRRFYEHHGLDWRRMAAAGWQTATGDLQGASTITQQLARNLFPQEIGNKRSLDRKLREAITALRIERAYSKPQILETYLNTTPFLYNVHGIEMAARTYFNKPASQLDTLESATLVGMLKGNHRYNPQRYPERARERRNVVLAQMARNGNLDTAALERLREQPLVLDFRRPDTDAGPARHFVEQVREQANEWADARGIDLDTAGLTIETTLDMRLQTLAESAVAQQVALLQRVAAREWSEARLRVLRATNAPEAKQPFAYFWQERPQLLEEMARGTPEFRAAGGDAAALAKVFANAAQMQRLREDKTRLTAGFVAVEPATGEVKAWVGSPDFARDQFDHVSQARRQPGSTFKPFVYGAALQRGFSTEREFIDEPVQVPLPDGTLWTPTDAGGPSYGVFTMRQGLAQSKNTITAQVARAVGLPPVMRFAQAAGVRQSKLEAVPSLALGTSPVTLLEMATAYATLAALGERRAPVMLRRIVDRDGVELARFGGAEPERAIERNVTEQLVDMMRGVVASGTGTAVRTEFGVRGDLAGKTGTTQNNTDGWFLLMQPGLVAGAWVGFNDQRVTWRSDWWGQGGHNALRIVGDFFREGQRTGLIDTQASFPKVARPEPVPVDTALPEGVTEEAWLPAAPPEEKVPAVEAGLPADKTADKPAEKPVRTPPVAETAVKRAAEPLIGFGSETWVAAPVSAKEERRPIVD